MNKLTIIGNLTKDPETRVNKNGNAACTFSVAVNHKVKGGEKETQYFRVSAWNKLGEICQQYLAKGKKVCVIGRVSMSMYTGNDGQTRGSLDVMAEDVEILSPAGEQRGQASAAEAPAAQFTAVENPDELPF